MMSKRNSAVPRVPLTVRLPETLVSAIDRNLQGRAVPVSRNNWLIEAAIEKLERDGLKGTHGSK